MKGGTTVVLLFCMTLCGVRHATAQAMRYTYVFNEGDFPIAYSVRSLERYEVVDTARYRLFYASTASEEDLMVLEVGSRYADFYSRGERSADSAYTARIGTLPPNSPNEYSGQEQVLTDRRAGVMTCYNRLPLALDAVVVYEDKVVPEWHLTHELDTVAGFPCYSARTSFRGRVWTAHYTADLPDALGPWKFRGLPGMILAIEDEEGRYGWRCVGVAAADMQMKRFAWDVIRLPRKKWLKMQRNIFLDPAAYASDRQIVLRKMVGDRIVPFDDAGPVPYDPVERE